MSQIQITIPNEPKENVEKVISTLTEKLEIKNMLLLKGDNNSLIIIRRKPTRVPEVIKTLNSMGVGTVYGIIDIITLKATIPELAIEEEGPEKEDEVESRVSLEEIKNAIGQNSAFSFNYLIFILLSALVAAAGLILNSSTVLIASMILSPLMGPILGVSFGFAIKDKKLVRNGFISQLYGLIIAFGVGIGLGLFSVLVQHNPPATSAMLSRNFPSYFDIAIAICGGLAVGFVVTGTIQSALVGVAIAVALMPPGVNIGVALIYGDYLLSLGSFVLLLANIIIINLCALLVFRVKKITAPPKIFPFWQGPRETIKKEEKEEKKGFYSKLRGRMSRKERKKA